MKSTQTPTLIIGASFSGLATAACLRQKGLDYIIIEKGSTIAPSWHSHYERLHLHTNKSGSQLPFKAFDKDVPQYPDRLEVINYLEEYRAQFNIQPLFNIEALRISRDGNTWITETASQTFISKNLVIATGAFGEKKMIRIAGLESFTGTVLHSSGFASGKHFKGKKVLVIGFGNSACEIALDLYEQGALSSISLRSPVNVVPRDLFGFPILSWSRVLNKFPPALADVISAPLIKWKIGNLEKLGLEKKAYGPFTEVYNDRKSPVIDIGTIKEIRAGHIDLFQTINRIEGPTVLFDDGRSSEFDAIIFGTGYHRNIPRIEGLDLARIRDLNIPAREQQYFGKDGLYFCGFFIGATGQINEIAKDAVMIANRISLFLSR